MKKSWEGRRDEESMRKSKKEWIKKGKKVHERVRKRKRNDERDVHRSEPVHCHIDIRISRHVSTYPIGSPARTCNSSIFYFSIVIDRNRLLLERFTFHTQPRQEGIFNAIRV